MRSEVSVFANAVKAAEQAAPNLTRARPNGKSRLVGSYGIPADEWPEMAALAGMPGANWRDQTAQDAVVETIFDILHEKYRDWRLVAIAWKAGERIADAVMADPKLYNLPELTVVKSYAQRVAQIAAERDVIGSDDPDPTKNIDKLNEAQPVLTAGPTTKHPKQRFSTGTLRSPQASEPTQAPSPPKAVLGGTEAAKQAVLGILGGLKARQISRTDFTQPEGPQ